MSMPAEHLGANFTLNNLLEGIVDAPRIPVSGIATD